MTRFLSPSTPRSWMQRWRQMLVGVATIIVGAVPTGLIVTSSALAAPTPPPPVTVLTAGGNAGQGDIFITPTGDTGTYANGPEILDSHGNVVWFQAAPQGQTAADFRAQTYRGQPVLTWWQGTGLGGLSSGTDYIYNDHFQQIATVNAGDGLSADGHEFLITPQNTALILSYTTATADLTSIGGPSNQTVVNGVVQEIPNQMNLNWFFDGINQANASKSFVMKIPRYGEIWWCYPRGSATECSHAVIYNYREKTWYDTPLPNTGRSSGLHADNLVGNIMGGLLPYTSSVSGSPTTYFNLWEHEQGTDEINGTIPVSVPSSFTTSAFTNFNAEPPTDVGVTMGTMQPDFIQTGNMTVTVLKQNNPKDAMYLGSSNIIYANPTNPLDQVTNIKDTAKIMQLQFTSNVIGGDYQMGQTMVDLTTDGVRDT